MDATDIGLAGTLAGTLVSVVAFIASVIFYIQAQKLQSAVTKALTQVAERTGGTQSAVQEMRVEMMRRVFEMQKPMRANIGEAQEQLRSVSELVMEQVRADVAGMDGHVRDTLSRLESKLAEATDLLDSAASVADVSVKTVYKNHSVTTTYDTDLVLNALVVMDKPVDAFRLSMEPDLLDMKVWKVEELLHELASKSYVNPIHLGENGIEYEITQDGKAHLRSLKKR